MLAYGVTALAVPGVTTGENSDLVFANLEGTMYAQNYLEAAGAEEAGSYLAQQSDFEDEYSYDLAQTYSELEEEEVSSDSSDSSDEGSTEDDENDSDSSSQSDNDQSREAINVKRAEKTMETVQKHADMVKKEAMLKL